MHGGRPRTTVRHRRPQPVALGEPNLLGGHCSGVGPGAGLDTAEVDVGLEKVSHGRPVSCVLKTYAVYGGSCKTLDQDRRLVFPAPTWAPTDGSGSTAPP